MTIQVRYAQDIPEPPVVTLKPKDGKEGVAGVAGTAGVDLTNLPPVYFDANTGDTIVLDLAVSRQFRITAVSGPFQINFLNSVDGARFLVAVRQTASGPITPTFGSQIMWNLNAGAPTLDDGDGVHSVYGFEAMGEWQNFDGYLLGKTFTPFWD